MIKISKIDAYAGMDEIDFKVMDQELNQIFSQRGNKEMTHQFFLDGDGECIVMEVYFDGKLVETYRFKNKGVLTDTANAKIGRPSLGITKKVSITLREQEWETLDQLQKEIPCDSRSELLRHIIREFIDEKLNK
jgi:hypothetical protein